MNLFTPLLYDNIKQTHTLEATLTLCILTSHALLGFGIVSISRNSYGVGKLCVLKIRSGPCLIITMLASWIMRRKSGKNNNNHPVS